MLKKRGDVKSWLKKAISKGYTPNLLRGILLRNGFSHMQVLKILSLYEKAKQKNETQNFVIKKPIQQKPNLQNQKVSSIEELRKKLSKKSLEEPKETKEVVKNPKDEKKNVVSETPKQQENEPKIMSSIITVNPTGKAVEEYNLEIDKAKVIIKIEKTVQGMMYVIYLPELKIATKALLDEIRKELISISAIAVGEIMDQKAVGKMKRHFMAEAGKILKSKLPNIGQESEDFLIGILMQEMLGLGKIEFMINDPNLEEIVIVSSKEIRVYHKKYGWLLTNIQLASEDEVTNYANIIARRVGRQISILNPLLDAHVVTGDRANAVLYPIATKGNTITIRKFARDPWTIVDLIQNNTMSKEIAALLWLAIEYEMNVIFSGGTASGKTVCLNACMPFIPPNHRVISMEDTRELMLPKFLYWTPLVTRTANAEDKGAVTMLDLLVNSLRMRPDRIILGEMRRQKEAEVLFEAMHTGHSVYATVHADTASETIRRLTNPPISVPPSMLGSVNLNVVMFRDRRRGVRRAFQLAEYVSGKNSMTANLLYRWIPEKDSFTQHNKSLSFYDELSRNTGMDEREIEKRLKFKEAVFDWLIKHKIRDLQSFGKLMNLYYTDKEKLQDVLKNNKVEEIIERNPSK